MRQLLPKYSLSVNPKSITIAEFQETYPTLYSFSQERGWRCGQSFISWRW